MYFGVYLSVGIAGSLNGTFYTIRDCFFERVDACGTVVALEFEVFVSRELNASSLSYVVRPENCLRRCCERQFEPDIRYKCSLNEEEEKVLEVTHPHEMNAIDNFGVIWWTMGLFIYFFIVWWVGMIAPQFLV